MATLSTLALRCFGSPTAWVDGRDAPPDVLWRKHLALLIYLSLSPDRTRTRDHLIGLLWPEKPEKDARHSLNEAIRRLRVSLGEGRMVSRSDALTLSGENLEVDALRFLSVVDRDPVEALSLRVGDFLDGLVIGDAPPLEEWAANQRSRFRSRSVTALLTVAEVHLGSCRFAEARDAAGQAQALDPYSEPAIQLVLRSAALGGDTAGALAAHREFTDRLTQNIGERQSRQLEALVDRIRRQDWRPVVARQVQEEAPLVGREPIHRESFRLAAEGMIQGPQTLLITGAPGMGRTRLLTECASRLALEGAFVATARPLPSDTDNRWSTLRLLMHGGLGRAPGLMGAAPTTLAILAAVAPEMVKGIPPLEPKDTADVARALSDALAACADEQPVVVAIDDAQHADGLTLSAVRGALEQLQGTRVSVLITARTDTESPSVELLQLRQEVGRRIAGAAVRLDPLDEASMKKLASRLAPWCRDDGHLDRLARRLTVETGGSPFFAVTLLRGLQRLSTFRDGFVAWPQAQGTYETPLPFSLPDLLGTAVAARLVELTETGRRVLSAATIGGPAFDLDLIQHLCDCSREAVEEALAAAERRHLVTFDGERYAFTASVIAEVVRGECLTPGLRQGLTRRAAAYLEPRTDLESRVLRIELLAKVEAGSETFIGATALARQAVSAGVLRTARRAVTAAQQAAGKNPSREQSAEMEELRRRLDGETVRAAPGTIAPPP